MNIVYEHFKILDFSSLAYYLFLKNKVWVVEPFHAYHHHGKIRFYPKPLPGYVKYLIRKGKVSLLTADRLNPGKIYFNSANKAVDTADIVYPSYKRDHLDIISFFCSALESLEAENILRKELCDKLAVFYSVNNLICNIKSCFPKLRVKVYIEKDLIFYNYFRKLSLDNRIDVLDDCGVTIASSAIAAHISNVIKKLLNIVMLGGLACVSAVLIAFSKQNRSKDIKKYKFAITILSPRQLRNNKRRADFIVDDGAIKKKDVVFIPLIPLSAGQKRELSKLKGDIFLPSSKFICVHPVIWLKLLKSSLKTLSRKASYAIIYDICRGLLEYFRWTKILEVVKFDNLITHADFSSSRIARSILLEKSKIKTWYFSDSINFSGFYVPNKKVSQAKHPFWAYLKYDNFITVNNFIKDYFYLHPNSIANAHIVGSIWSDYVNKEVDKLLEFKDKFIISAFDTTYSVNSFTSYDEGIAFAKDLLKLLKELPDIALLIKEKKDRNFHAKLDFVKGERLAILYDEIAKHPRSKVLGNKHDPLDLILSSNMVVSFPFTSPTFEALSVNKPAIWHDPLGLYGDTVYGENKNVCTHSYDGFKKKIIEIKNMTCGWGNPFPEDSPLMDPFRDGKALERFRGLLVKNG